MKKVRAVFGAVVWSGLVAVGAYAAVVTCARPAEAKAKKQSITIAWAQWEPSNYLTKLAKQFTKQTGIKVRVDQTSWADFENRIQNDIWANRKSDYDLILGDSQWLGRGATGGHYVDLTSFVQNNVPLSDLPEAAQEFYCKYDGRFWAVPAEADALGMAYRKDLFESAAEKAAFQDRYGYPLAPPTTWAQFRDVAEFFTRPGQGLYGAALLYAGLPDYDSATMAFDQILWSWGGNLHDAAGTVEGVLNSPTAVEAMEFYARTLRQFTPPGPENFGINNVATLKAFEQGQVAMTQCWYTFFPELLDHNANPHAHNTGFFTTPAGPGGHFISLGGQGMSLSSYSKKKSLALKFLKWFSKNSTQRQWGRLGGLPAYTSVLNRDEFLNATAFNHAFAASVPKLKDFYNNPRYTELLESTQRNWGAAVKGELTPKQALDNTAAEHTQILSSPGSADTENSYPY